MIEGLQTLGMALVMLAVFAALGSGPTMALGRGLVARAAAAPIVGLGLAGSAVSTAAYLMPMRIAVWAVLVPLAVASAAWAAWLLRGSGRPSLTGIAAPAAAAAAALAAGVAPGFGRGTLGPLSLASGDAWGYIFAGLWLNDHTLRDDLPAGGGRFDVVGTTGWTVARLGGDRQGSNALSGAFAELMRVSPDDIHLAFLAAALALIPLGIWVLARALGAGTWPSAVGSLMGASPALVTLATDSRLGNLAGLALIPVVLLVVARAVRRGGRGPLILAALMTGGLIANYILFLVPLVVLVGIGAIALAGLRRRRGLPLRDWARAGATRAAIVGAGALAASPVTVARISSWYRYISSDEPRLAAIPGWSLAFDNGPGWAFGLLHLHELGGFDSLAAPLQALAIGLPVLLVAIVVVGALSRGLRGGLLVLAPIGITLVLSAYSYFAYDDCVYCVWKALTLMLPFLGVGMALGLDRLARRPPGRGPRARAGWVAAVAAVTAVTLAGVGRANTALVHDWQRTSAALTTEARGLTASVAGLPRPASLMLEGIDATPAPAWTLLELDYLAREGGDPLVSFTWPAAFGRGFYSPDYEYVASTFGGLSGGRRLIAHHGTYSLFRRAPIDVVIGGTGWSAAPEDAPNAVPWVLRSFELSLASARSGPARLEVDYARPLERGSILFFSDDAALLPNATTETPGAVRACVDVTLQEGRTVVRATPLIDRLPPTELEVLGLWPVGSPPRALAVTRLAARPGRCPESPASPVVPAALDER